VEGLRASWRPAESLAESQVRVLDYSNNKVDLVVQTSGPQYLVSSETYYPGWSATINGNPARLYPTNLAFRGLPVPKGTNYLTMTYSPEFMWLWCLLTGFSLLATLFLICKPSPALE
jgi:uncharacterized membrane protein YfhO